MSEGGLNVEIGVTLDRLTKQLASAEQRMIRAAKRSEQEFQRRNRGAADSFRQIDAAAQRTSGLVGRLGGTIAGAFVGGFAFGAIQQGFAKINRAIGQTLTELDTLAKTADRVGVGIEDLQGLQRGFGLAGVEVGELNNGLEQFARRLGDAAQGGAFSKVLDRFSISLRNQQGELRPTIDLLKDFADATKNLPEAQKLAAAQEAFGRSGLGFVNALGDGSRGLEKFIEDAREAGTVLDERLVRKAEEVGDRFYALGLRLKVFWQEQLLEIVTFVDNLTDAKLTIDEILNRPPAQILGGQIDPTANIGNARQELEDYTAALDALEQEAIDVADEMISAGASIRAVVGEADDTPISEFGIALTEVGTALRDVAAEYKAGTIDGEKFREKTQEIEKQALETFSQIEGIDSLGFSSVIARLGGLGGALSRVADIAFAAAKAVAAVGASTAPDAPGPDGARRQRMTVDSETRRQTAANNSYISEQTRINGLTREQIALEREVQRVREDSAKEGAALSEAQIALLAQERIAAEAARSAATGKSGGGKGSGKDGGKSRKDEVAELLEQGARQIEQLEFESTLLGKTAEQVLFLTTQYELLRAAKEKGLELDVALNESGETLRQQIDAQAEAVANLTQAYEMAKEKAEFFKDITDDLKQGLIDSIVEGNSFKGVLEDVAKALAKAALQAALFGTGPLASLFGGSMVGTGLLSFIPGFSSGGYTGAGGKNQPKGLVHGGEYVFSKAAVNRIGVKNLESMHRQLKGYSEGGAVGGNTALPQASSPQVQVVVIDNEEKFGQYLAANPRAEREVMNIVKRNGG
jgi:hypothetical protein